VSASEEEEEGEGVAVAAPSAPALVDGERVPISEKELGAVELFPQAILHNANGRFIAVCGDNEYVIYTSQALRNKSFGSALDFVWSSGGVGDYAVRESTSKVKIFRNFKETTVIKPPASAEGLSGGALLGVRSSDTVCFFEWETGRMLRRIEVSAKALTWNESGDLVAITSEDAFYVLRYVKEAAVGVDPASQGEEGVEAAFELQHEVSDKVQGGVWVGDCFVYTNANNRLNYYVGGEVITLAHLDRRMYVLGYLAKEGRVFLMDKTGTLTSYGLCLAVLEYQTVVVRRDFAAANRILADVPKEHRNAIAKFLEGQGFKEQALAVADDPDTKFDLALQLNKLDVARSLLADSAAVTASAAAAGVDPASSDANELTSKWKQLLDLALATGNLDLAQECAVAAGDLGTLLLLYTSTGDVKGLVSLGAAAEAAGADNIAFYAYHCGGSLEGCARVLASSGQGVESEVFSQVFAKVALAAAPSAAAATSPSADEVVIESEEQEGGEEKVGEEGEGEEKPSGEEDLSEEATE